MKAPSAAGRSALGGLGGPQTVFRPAAFGGDAGFALLIGVWGAGHGGYVKRMHAAVDAISEGRTRLDVKLCRLVNLMRNGEPECRNRLASL